LHQQQLEHQQKLLEQQQQQQKLLEQQQQQQQQTAHQPMDQVQYQKQPEQLVYQQPDQVQYQQQQQTYAQVAQKVDSQQYQQAQSQNAQAVPIQYQNSVDQAPLQAQVNYQNVEQAKVQYQQSVEQPPVQYQQSGQAHGINQQQSVDQAQIAYQQAVDHANKVQYQQSVDQVKVVYQAVEPGVQQLQYPNSNNVQVQQYQHQTHQQAPNHLQETQLYQTAGVVQQQQAPQGQQVQSGGQATHQVVHQPVIQSSAQHLQQPSAQQYQQQQLHLVPLQQVGDALQGLSCIQQVQPVHEMIKEEQTGQLTLMMSGVHGVEARVLESEELVRAVEEQPHSQIMQEPIHPMVKKIQEIQSMPVVQNIETGYDTSHPVVDTKNLAVEVPSLTSGGIYLSPGSVGASGTSGYNSQQSTVTSDIGVTVDPVTQMPVNTMAGQDRDKVSCVSSDFERSACPPTALRPAIKLDHSGSCPGKVAGAHAAWSTDRPLVCGVEDHPHPPVPGWVTAPIIFTSDNEGHTGRESRRGSLPVAQAGTSLLFPQPNYTKVKAHSAETSPKCLSASSYSSLSLKLPFPSQSLRRRSADPSDLYRSRQSHRHISGSTSPTSGDELLALPLPLLEQRRASGGSALLSPLWEQLPGHSCLLMSCPHSNCSSQSNMSNMLTIREVMSMTSSQTSLASTQVLYLHMWRRHPTTLCSPSLTPALPH